MKDFLAPNGRLVRDTDKEVRDLQEPVNKLIEGGGGVYGVVVCKDGELTRYFHLIQKIETKGDVVAALSRIAELAFFQFNEKLERKDLS